MGLLTPNDTPLYSLHFQRKRTLLRDYKERDKTNQLLDKRFGNDDEPEEERELQRFLLETKVINNELCI